MDFVQRNVMLISTPLLTQDSGEASQLELQIEGEVKGKCTLLIVDSEGEINDLDIYEPDNFLLCNLFFKNMEQIAIEKRLNTIYLTISHKTMGNLGKISTIEQAISTLNWNLKTSQQIFLFDGVKMDTDQWIRTNHLNTDFSIDNLTTLTSQEKEEIKQGKNIWYPDRFDPFQYQTIGRNSLVLRYKGQVIGWCITELASENILMYDNLFVKEQFWNMARSISLFGTSLRMQCEESDIRYITFTVHGDNTPLLKILHKKTADYIVDFKELRLYKLAL
ncbi:hypothetical protein [Metabacillus fastidiosus]|uniref:N-acetyltransferase domain-containing protein n=1 Tax=Metabacillus fastidiosus TaxID=1458 RepID=A0ABU6NW41_9BACI|nr:hypothetical protein [Metabacillus fastidiosus]MED4401348.1 hypothetical protein [Metabacillus fastidiosus]MED4461701.1 hypothetical protein [Metabacillus fastidiosus]